MKRKFKRNEINEYKSLWRSQVDLGADFFEGEINPSLLRKFHSFVRKYDSYVEGKNIMAEYNRFSYMEEAEKVRKNRNNPKYDIPLFRFKIEGENGYAVVPETRKALESALKQYVKDKMAEKIYQK